MLIQIIIIMGAYKMYRCGVTLKDGNIRAENFKSKEECETWLLELMEKCDLKRSIIVNKSNIKERWLEKF